MSILPLITNQSQTSATNRSARITARPISSAALPSDVSLQAICAPCIGGITVCCELSGFPPKLECYPRPC